MTVEPLAAGNGAAFWNSLTQVINTESGAASYLSNQQTLKDTTTPPSMRCSPRARCIQLYHRWGDGTWACCHGGGAAPIAGALGVVAAGAAIAGFLCGTVAMGNDLVNIYTNVTGLVNNEPM